MKTVIIGLGGIGSHLSNLICRFLNYQSDMSKVLLVDGDEFEMKNRERQDFSDFGNKAKIKYAELRGCFLNLDLSYSPYYVDEKNMNMIEDDDIVLLCVDNHKTRKLVSDYCSKMNNITLISGGNELTDGNVQIFIRKEGKNVTPTLTDYHPEINNPDDKSPDEMSCEELHASEPQLLFTNLTVATIMCWAYYNLKEYLKDNNKVPSEVYFDILEMKLDTKYRTIKN